MISFTQPTYCIPACRCAGRGFPYHHYSATCTCPAYQKQYICKHTLGIAIRTNKYDPCAQAKNVPIGQKPKRGRPALAKRALLRQ